MCGALYDILKVSDKSKSDLDSDSKTFIRLFKT